MGLLGRLVIGHPVTAWIVVICIGLAAFAAATRIEFDDGLRTAFAGESEAYFRYEANRARFNQADADLAILARAPDLSDPGTLAALRDLTLELGLATNIADIYSIFSLREAPDANGDTRPLFPLDLSDRAANRRMLDRARDHLLGGRRLISQDGNAVTIVASLEPGADEIGSARDALAEIGAIADQASGGTKLVLGITGLAAVRDTVISAMIRDLFQLTAIGALVGALACFIVLRDPMLTFLNTLPPATALLWCLGALGGTGLGVNTLTNAIPVLILVLSFADSLHLTAEVRRQRPLHASADAAILTAVERIAPACALTSFTTAMAFAALLFSDSELIRSLGLAGTITTLLALVAVLAVHPLVMALAGRIGIDLSRRRIGPDFGSRFWTGWIFYRPALRRAPCVAGAALVVLATALAAYWTVRPVYSFLEFSNPHDKAAILLNEIERDIAPVGSIDIPIRIETDGDGHPSAAGLDRLAGVHRRLEAAAEGREVVSLATVARWIAPDGAADSAPMARLLDDLPEAQRKRLLSRDGDVALIRVFTTDEGAAATRALVDRLAAAAGPEAEDPDRSVGRPTGLLAMTSAISFDLILQLNACFVVAVAASGLFIMLWFRSVTFGLLALIPNILPIAMVGGWLAWSGAGLQFTSAVALTIAFGIAVDDTVHVFNRIRLVAPRGHWFDARTLARTMADVSPVLIATTFVLALGMIGTLFGSSPTISYFGILVITVFILALIADLMVLPALLLIAGRLQRAPKNSRMGNPDLR